MSSPHIPDHLRDLVRHRASGKCEYCRTDERTQVASFACDHVIPVNKGGSSEAGNLAWACPRCNASKGSSVTAVDPTSGREVPFFNPRQDRWDDHFRWSFDSLTIEPRSAVGRATVARLKMNRPRMVEIRRYLKRLGLHPPTDG
ncbi:MAG: HNH endonuclease [Phycisphaerae bacterium]|nr:HNH endonuclease [Phycisphaerae bacterium]